MTSPWVTVGLGTLVLFHARMKPTRLIVRFAGSTLGMTGAPVNDKIAPPRRMAVYWCIRAEMWKRLSYVTKISPNSAIGKIAVVS